MKFGKRYTEYVEKEGHLLKGCSCVEFKRHKKTLKHCVRQELLKAPPAGDPSSVACNGPIACPVCDGNFFPNLLKEISAVVGCFKSCAQQLLEFHLSPKFQRMLLRMRHNFGGDHDTMIHQGRNLVNYASMNAMAIRKILKKYDKVHCSIAGQAFKTRLQSMHAELLQSPWLIELTALYINLKDEKDGEKGENGLKVKKDGKNGESSACSGENLSSPEGLAHCSCECGDSKATLQSTLVDSQAFEADLTCSICLETLFDPVALGCGHLFCNTCACSAASIPTIQGVKSATKEAKCPLCRQPGVYLSAVFLTELNLMIRNRCMDYWDERLKKERVERVQQVKEHWENQMKMVLGM
ncbi:probable E3 ubiquitin-protein ligase BAH1-like 1 isoform X2 [Selaginella moellendorffii]|uniref:probable E3 ubiquitin-protein ligase BAH1-like 1 isoform X2 n=1 Tax=Selaginella moellendorffii TaxID=88036 RepID=UPI000D1C9A92|nr:probable E3 ubiquitin-protein ligase BAH1-like 1 isoform X2 [Selaginella moellendorffii]|eukprot:XP_024531425.1 probable E3 ubiquitin-protein ligase BAH1-like 1 isoform X2 [Selaginella moellendorffii]